MCFVHAWYWCSLVRAIANWLLQKSVIMSSVMPKSCEMSEQSQSASFAAYVAAMYLLSVVDSEIIVSCLVLQETALPLMMKAYPDITFLSSAMLPSASPYPTISLCCLPYPNHNSFVPKRYLKICLMASQ